jgi:hypothetical protein
MAVNDKGLTVEGMPRKRAKGAGRPPKHGEATRSIRVPMSVPTELVTSIPDLQRILDHYEEECTANPSGVRYYFLRQMIEEIRALGY